MVPEQVWYAAYGSNTDPTRLGHYLAGGTPEGASLGTPGARDATPPRASRAVDLPGSVFFAGESPTWGGGVAFYDVHGAGTSVGRAWLLSAEQFSDVAVQEMHRPPGEDLDLETLLREGTHAYGPGHYETLHVVSVLDGLPVLTFTAPPDSPVGRALNPPSAAYLRVMGGGLLETVGDAGAVADYLLARPGIGGWERDDVLALL